MTTTEQKKQQIKKMIDLKTNLTLNERDKEKKTSFAYLDNFIIFF